jgi:putative protein-disulfide isomerase
MKGFPMTHLIYVADPMCSWCYGFGPELSAFLKTLPDVQLDIVVGGLRPYNKKVLDLDLKTTLLLHWERVAEASGLPFNQDALDGAGFIYDSEPACRALVTARLLWPDVPPLANLGLCRAIQHAFYAQGLNVTQGEVLAQVMVAALAEAGFATDAAQFLALWQSETALEETRRDFEQTQRWGIRGFPALVLAKEDTLVMMATGYTKAAVLAEHLAQIDEGNG